MGLPISDMEAPEINLSASDLLTDAELDSLTVCLPPGPKLLKETRVWPIKPPSAEPPLRSGNLSPHQFSLGFDPSTLLTLLFAPLPALFIARMAQEAGKDFWEAIKKILGSYSRRSRAVHVDSLQIRLATEDESNHSVEYVITSFHALHVPTQEWVNRMAGILDQLKDPESVVFKAIRNLRSSQHGQSPADGSLRIHVVLDGASEPVWFIEQKDLHA